MSSGSSIFGQKNPFIGIKEFHWMINICTDRFRRKKISYVSRIKVIYYRSASDDDNHSTEEKINEFSILKLDA